MNESHVQRAQILHEEIRQLTRLLDKYENSEAQLRRRNVELNGTIEHLSAVLAKSSAQHGEEKESFEELTRSKDQRIAELEEKLRDTSAQLSAASEELIAERQRAEVFEKALLRARERVQDGLSAASRSMRASRFTVKGESLSLQNLLQSLAHQGVSGVLCVGARAQKIDLFLSAGNLFFLNPRLTTLRDEEEGLCCSGFCIPRRYIEEYLSGPTRNEDSIYFRLIEDGVIGEKDLLPLMFSLGLELLCRCLVNADDCLIQFFEKDVPPESFLNAGFIISIPKFLLKLFSRLDETEALRSEFEGARFERLVDPTGDAREEDREHAHRLLDAVDGQRGIAEIARECHLTHFETLKALEQLIGAGFVRAVTGP